MVEKELLSVSTVSEPHVSVECW